MSLRHAPSHTAVRPAPLMGGRGGSAVEVVVVARGTSTSIERVLGNRYVEGRSSRFCVYKNKHNKTDGNGNAMSPIKV